jgi:hypothetical protein
MNKFVLAFTGCFALVAALEAQPARFQIKPSDKQEALMVISNINHPSLAFRREVISRMLEEANYFAERLKLPTPHPIQMTDIRYTFVSPPWYCVINETEFPYWPATIFTNKIFDSSIPREQRLRAIKFGVRGTIETTNFFFSFERGRLWEVERLSEHEVKRYAHNLDDLVGKPSLIDTNGAYQLATQWLASVNVDVTALERQFPHSVNQLHYQPRGATNAVVLPLYYVDFGLNPIHRDSPVEVEILGTTKELQELIINDLSFSRRPLMPITNALELIRTPNPPKKRLQPMPNVQTNSAVPP